jgi:hypothetical protein
MSLARNDALKFMRGADQDAAGPAIDPQAGIRRLRKRLRANQPMPSRRLGIPRRRRALFRASQNKCSLESLAFERQSLEHEMMATREIDGRPVTVDDSFPELSLEQQQAKANEIAVSLTLGKYQYSATRDGPMSSKKPSRRLIGTRI